MAAGCAGLSSCDTFKKDEPAPANEPYTAAAPYAAGAASAATPPATASMDAYGAPSPGGYTTPNYSQPPNQPYNQPYTQPYVQPSTPPVTGPGYGGQYTPPATGTAGAAGSGRTYKVVRGDNLSKIGQRYGVSVADLKRANNLTSDTIVEGRTLNIP